jgi:acetyl esterase/lipase
MAIAQDRLTPAARALIDRLADQPPLPTLTPAQARGLPTLLSAAPEAVASVVERAIPGPGEPMTIRIYRPQAATSSALVYFHGGGWVIGSLAGADGACRALANHGACVVISIGYRLAPETKFPGPVDDAYASVRWVADHANDLAIDTAKIAVGGSSAGGNLAAAAALVSRDRGGPTIAFQLLVVPVADLRYGAKSHDDFAVGYGLTKADMEWYASQYLLMPEDADHPYASVARADLRGMPPAFVITAECDPLRDDGELYAAKLRELGIAATAKRYAGMFHGFMAFPHLLPEASAALDDAGAALRAALG